MSNDIQGVHHIGLSVPDLQKARDFYVGLLGFEEVWRWAWTEGTAPIDEMVGMPDSAAKVMMLRNANLELELFEYTSPEPSPLDPMRTVNQYGFTHFALRVRDIDAVYRRLLDAGTKFHRPPMKGAAINATYGRDPFGNVFELFEITAGEGLPG